MFNAVVIPLFNLILDKSSGSSYPWLTALLVLINSIIQVCIICLLTSVASKKLDFSVKKLTLTLPLLYLLFVIYHQPSLYMFVYTDEWYLIFSEHTAMPTWEASIFITLQYGIVMLITTLAVNHKSKSSG
jgi:hypothetical protein